jgi:hypothetical protein
MATDYLFQQSEVVAKRMPEYFGRFNVASNFVKKGAVERIGERDFRVPFLTQEGGRVGTYNPDGGALGRGTASKGGVLIGTYFSLRLNFELTELAVEATSSKRVAQFNAFKRAMKAGFPEFAQYVDKFWHSDGSAVLGTATAQATVSSKTVYTMDLIQGVQHVRRGMPVIVYQNDLSAWRDSGTSFIIEQIDYDARKVYLDATVAAAAANDKLVFEGVSGASPAGLKGLYYFNDYSTSGTTLGINRATEWEIVANSVDAGGVPTHTKALQLSHKIMKRRGEMPKGQIGFVAPEQQANIYDQVMNIANYDLSRGSVKDDLVPGADNKFKFGGMPMFLDIHQRTDRIDVIQKSSWLRARLTDVKFYEVGGQRFFQLYDSSTGSPAASIWFGLVLHEDYVCDNPGQQGVIYGCSQPTY